jgi:hypothetical protein
MQARVLFQAGTGEGPKSGDSGTERIARLFTKKSRINPFTEVYDGVPGSHILDAGKACDNKALCKA